MSKYKEVLKQYWGYDAFRPLQEEIIESVGKDSDTLALMPTGGGKSITFQVPTLAREGICLVLTPLIALMNDQVEQLRSRGIKAMSIHSGMTRHEISTALDNCVFGDIKFLYLSPERLASEMFRVRVQQMNVNLIAVDEAHCISQWGYDFRPSYLKIAELRTLLPEVPILALTATATPAVAKDIMERLEFEDGKLLQKSFGRENLAYIVRNTEDKPRELLKIVSKVEGSGIVYARNRRKTREIAEFLREGGIQADYYHAGLKYETRMQKQAAWQKDELRVIVSTNAFGMGIDKPNVRFVVHLDMPDSPEAYFQEAGRAGRDEVKAWAILLYSPADERRMEQRIRVSFPDFKILKEVYRKLFNYLQIPVGGGKGASFDFIMGEFLSRNKIDALTLSNALSILSREGYFEITEEINNPSRIHFTCGREELYFFEKSNPKYDHLLKTLLRTYTGLFSQYVAFDEQYLARRAGIEPAEVNGMLSSLATQKMISYIPKKQNPVITLFEERLEDKNVYISRERYQFRKERFIGRAKTMLDYAGTENKCRSKLLLYYFGEKKSKKCGQCDVCLGDGEKRSPGSEADIKTQLLESLRSTLSLSELSKQAGIEEEKLMPILESLIEEAKVVRRKDLKFELKK